MGGNKGPGVSDLKYEGSLHPKTGSLKMYENPRLCLGDRQACGRKPSCEDPSPATLFHGKHTEFKQS